MIKLIAATPKSLNKVVVKITCSDEKYFSQGSGFITGVGSDTYVITCAHCIIKKDTKILFDNDKINISITYNYVPYALHVEDIMYDIDDDYAILKVDIPEKISFDYSSKVHFLKEDIGGIVTSYGYRSNNSKVTCSEFKWKSESVWQYLGVNLMVQDGNALRYWEGCSGSGLFYQEEGTDHLYVIAYLKGLKYPSGNYNEFVCRPISNVCKKLTGKVLKDVDCEFSNYDKNNVLETMHFRDINTTLLTEKQELPFISNDKTQHIIQSLRNADEMTVQLIGLSGLGKTRLLYEAFNTGLNIPNAYYCKYEDSNVIKTQFEQILERHNDDEGLIIIDDCPLGHEHEFIETRNRKNPDFRLITTNHDYFDAIQLYQSGLRLTIEPKDMESAVNEYIELALKPTDKNRTEVDEIKMMAEGYPQMALELVKCYQIGLPASADTVEFLIRKLLKFDADPTLQRKQEILMQTLSLCQPMPYKNTVKAAFDYMINSDKFTPLYSDTSSEERLDIVENLIDKYYPTLIEKQSNWLIVRPFPLAVWLTKKWFDNCNANRFKGLLKEMLTQNESTQAIISDSFCKHIEYMHGNKAAFDLVQKLVDPQEDDAPFLNEEVLFSSLGSKFFLAMSHVNPAAIAQGLAYILLPKTTEWIETNITDTVRGNIVWTLEKLCFAQESYDNAVKVFAKLAIAENDNFYSNNSIGQFKQLFHIYLPGTEVSYAKRLDTLKYMQEQGEEYKELTIGCIESALYNDSFTRGGGAEKFGMERKKDFFPKTYGEIFNYWRKCRDLLLNYIISDPHSIEQISHIVEKYTHQWVYEQRNDIFIPLLEKIAEVKNNDWSEEYEVLRRFKNNMLSSTTESDVIEEWIKKLRPATFITDLKEVRNTMWGNYRESDDYTIEEARMLFEPLVKQFIVNKIYYNLNELQLLLQDKDSIDNVFATMIKENMSEEQSNDLFNTLYKIIINQSEDFLSGFLNSICLAYKDTTLIENFMSRLKCKGIIYVQLMAYTENGRFDHLKLLKADQDNDFIADFLDIYLNNFQSLYKNTYYEMINEVCLLYPKKYNVVLNNIIIKYGYSDFSEEEKILPLIKQLAIKYDLDEVNQRSLSDYSRFVTILLEKNNDPKFAVSINKKLIKFYQTLTTTNAYRGIFGVLVTNYIKDVWDDFMNAFFDEDNYWFMWQIKYVVGSGFGFGAGPLFQTQYFQDSIPALCKKYPKTAPSRIAETAPCYKYVKQEDGSLQVVGFSDLFIWLLDTYGQDENVRIGIDTNVGSCTSIGSVIPYYDDSIKCYSQLFNHKYPEVSEWAKQNVECCKKNIEIEQNKEDYMNLRHQI